MRHLDPAIDSSTEQIDYVHAQDIIQVVLDSILIAMRTNNSELISVVNRSVQESVFIALNCSYRSKIPLPDLEPKIRVIIINSIKQVSSTIAAQIRENLSMLRYVHDLGVTKSPVITYQETLPDNVDPDNYVVKTICDSVFEKLPGIVKTKRKVQEIEPEVGNIDINAMLERIEELTLDEITLAIRNTKDCSEERFALCSEIIRRSKTDSSYDKLVVKAYLEMADYYGKRQEFAKAVEIMEKVIAFQLENRIHARYIEMSRSRKRKFEYYSARQTRQEQPADDEGNGEDVAGSSVAADTDDGVEDEEDEGVEEDEDVDEEEDEDVDEEEDEDVDEEELDLTEAPQLLRGLASWIDGVNEMSSRGKWHGRGNKLNIPNAEIEVLCQQLDARLMQQDVLCAAVNNHQFGDLLTAMHELLNGVRIEGRHIWNPGLGDQIKAVIAERVQLD